jgi:hypothetical protein
MQEIVKGALEFSSKKWFELARVPELLRYKEDLIPA